MIKATFNIILLVLLLTACATSPDINKQRGIASLSEAQEQKVLDSIGDHLSVSYKHDANWYNRLRAIEALDSRHITDEQRESLEIIAARDPDWRIKKEAQAAVDGGQTRSMIEAQEQKVLDSIGDHLSVSYKHDANWYNRLRAIEALDSRHITDEQRESLEIIAARDPDWRIRKEAQSKIQ